MKYDMFHHNEFAVELWSKLEIFMILQIYAGPFDSYSYSTDGIAVQLQWHLLNMNVIFHR